jgi:hypothetical protein
MPRLGRGAGSDGQPSLIDLATRLFEDGRSWAEAEASLTKAETGAIARRIITSVVMGVVALLVGFAAIVVLAQAAVRYLSQWPMEESLAGVIVGVVLLVVMALLGRWSILHVKPAKPVSAVYRWMFDSGKSGARP